MMVHGEGRLCRSFGRPEKGAWVTNPGQRRSRRVASNCGCVHDENPASCGLLLRGKLSGRMSGGLAGVVRCLPLDSLCVRFRGNGASSPNRDSRSRVLPDPRQGADVLEPRLKFGGAAPLMLEKPFQRRAFVANPRSVTNHASAAVWQERL